MQDIVYCCDDGLWTFSEDAAGQHPLRMPWRGTNRHGKQCYRESDGNGRLLSEDWESNMAAKRLYRTIQLHTGAFAILTCRITRRAARHAWEMAPEVPGLITACARHQYRSHTSSSVIWCNRERLAALRCQGMPEAGSPWGSKHRGKGEQSAQASLA